MEAVTSTREQAADFAVKPADSVTENNRARFESHEVVVCSELTKQMVRLPDEIWLQIFSYLPASAVWNVSASCVKFRNICNLSPRIIKSCRYGHPLFISTFGESYKRTAICEKTGKKYYGNLQFWRDRFIKRYKMSAEEADFRAKTPLTIAATMFAKAGLSFKDFCFTDIETVKFKKGACSYEKLTFSLKINHNFSIELVSGVHTTFGPQGELHEVMHIPVANEIWNEPLVKEALQQKKTALYEQQVKKTLTHFSYMVQQSKNILYKQETLSINEENSICLPGSGILLLSQISHNLYYVSEKSGELTLSQINSVTNKPITSIMKTESNQVALFTVDSVIIASWCSEKKQLNMDITYPLAYTGITLKKILPVNENYFLALNETPGRSGWAIWQWNYTQDHFVCTSSQPLYLQYILNCFCIDQNKILMYTDHKMFTVDKKVAISTDWENRKVKRISLPENTIGMCCKYCFGDYIAVNAVTEDAANNSAAQNPVDVSRDVLKLFKVKHSCLLKASEKLSESFEEQENLSESTSSHSVFNSFLQFFKSFILSDFPTIENFQTVSDIHEIQHPISAGILCGFMAQLEGKPLIVMSLADNSIILLTENEQGQCNVIATAQHWGRVIRGLTILSSDAIIVFRKNGEDSIIQLLCIEQQHDGTISLVDKSPGKHCDIDLYDHKLLFRE